MHILDAALRVTVSLYEIDYSSTHNICRRNLDDIEALTTSVKAQGVQSPVTLVTLPIDTSTVYRYRVVDGFRRCSAAAKAHLESIPALVLPEDTDELALLIVALTANLHSEEMNELDVGRALKRLKDDFELTGPQISDRLGVKTNKVYNLLALTGYPTDVQQALYEGKITAGHAKELIRLPEGYYKQFIDKVIAKELSVKALREEIGNYLKKLEAVKLSAKVSGSKTEDPNAPSKAELDEFDQKYRELQRQRRIELREHLVRMSRAYRHRSEHEVEHIDYGRLEDPLIDTLLKLMSSVPTAVEDLRAAIDRIENPSDDSAVEEATESEVSLVFFGGSTSKAASLFYLLLERIPDLVERAAAISRVKYLSNERMGGHSKYISVLDVENLASELKISLESTPISTPVSV